jgi:hypothetical protein
VQEGINDDKARGHLHFLVDTADDTGEAVIADSKMMIHGTSGNVGIGTDAPKSQLDIRGPADNIGADCAGVLTLSTADGSVETVTDDQLGRIDFQAPLEDHGSVGTYVGASIYAEAQDSFTASVNSTALVFATGTISVPIPRMIIDHNGSVGIGTAVPGRQLTVANDSVDAGAAIALVNSSNSTIAAGDILGKIEFQGDDDDMVTSNGAVIEAKAAVTWGDDSSSTNDCPTDLNFYAQSNDTGSTLSAPVMMVSQYPANSVTPGVNNATDLGTDALEWKQVYAIDTSINTSDERLKKNIENLNINALSKINALKPRTFDWRKYKANDANLIDRGSDMVGFIAQEVQSIIPEMVCKGTSGAEFSDENGEVLIPKGEESLGIRVSGNTMMAYMVKAIQELTAKVEALEAAAAK